MGKDNGGRKSPIKKLRNAKMLADVSDGLTVTEAAAKYGLSRSRASTILNGEETKELIKQSQNDIKTLITPSIERLEACIRDMMNPSNALKAALAVLKSHGLIRETVDLNHSFPKPVVIEKRDGSSIVLGTTADQGEEE
jgi:DNA-binding IclR family transcriptional regulator